MSTPAEIDLRLRRLENDRDDAYGELTMLSRTIDQKVDRLDRKIDKVGDNLDQKVDKVGEELATVKTQLADLPEMKAQLAAILAALSTGEKSTDAGA